MNQSIAPKPGVRHCCTNSILVMFGLTWSMPHDYGKIDYGIDYGIDYSKMALRPGLTELQTVGVRDGANNISRTDRTGRLILSEQSEPVPKANFITKKKTCL